MRSCDLLTELEDAANEARSQGDGLSGSLRVTVPLDPSLTFLQPHILSFAAENPEMRLFLDATDRVVDLTAERYDVAIRIGPLAESALRVRWLCERAQILCAAPAYLEAHGTPQSLDDLAQHKVIGHANVSAGQSWSFVDEAGELRSIRVTPRALFNNGALIAAAAAEGLGLVVLPDYLVNDRITSGALVPVTLPETPTILPLHALYSSGRPAQLKVRAFIDHMVTALK